MALLLNCGAVFLHIPKTAGSWIEKVLYEQNLVKTQIGHKHADIDRALYPHTYMEAVRFSVNRFPSKLLGKPTFTERPFLFCFVRHPLTWYESWWKFNCSLNWPQWGDTNDLNNWHPNARLNGLGDKDFNTFVRNVVKAAPGYVSDLYGRYASQPVDFVGRQESLAEDLIDVLKRLNVRFDEAGIRNRARVNESAHKDPIKWDSGLRKEVEKLELAGLRQYRYC